MTVGRDGAEIRAFMDGATRDQVSLVTRKISLEVLSGVVMRTPVDTGRARGAWVTSIGAATGSEPGTFDKGGGTTVSNGAAVIGTQKGFDKIVMENNVPYINRLEEGHSKQAPNGMVTLTLAGLGLSAGREG